MRAVSVCYADPGTDSLPGRSTDLPRPHLLAGPVGTESRRLAFRHGPCLRQLVGHWSYQQLLFGWPACGALCQLGHSIGRHLDALAGDAQKVIGGIASTALRLAPRLIDPAVR